MTTVRQITEVHCPDSEFIRNLVRVFREARKERLQFAMDLHSTDEDCGYLSGVVLRENHVWVAEVDCRLAGFIAFAHGWVNHLYIAPAFQRQGLGTQLLAIAKRASQHLQLWVFEVNSPAIRFYQNQGFRVAERTDGTTNEAKMPDLRMEWNGNSLGG